MPGDATSNRLREAERHRLLKERDRAGDDAPRPENASTSGSDEPDEEVEG